MVEAWLVCPACVSEVREQQYRAAAWAEEE